MKTLQTAAQAALLNWGTFFAEVDYPGRLAVANTIEKYIGLTDKKGNYAYIRFDGENDYTVEAKKTGANSSSLIVSCEVAIVICAQCKNIEEIAFTVAALLAKGVKDYAWEVKSVTCDTEAVYEGETGKTGIKNNRLRLAIVRAVVSWNEDAVCSLDGLVCEKC